MAALRPGGRLLRAPAGGRRGRPRPPQALAVALPLGAAAPAAAEAGFPSTEGWTSTSSILTHDDVVRELQKLGRASRYGVDAFTLAEAGTEVSTSGQGRDLWARPSTSTTRA